MRVRSGNPFADTAAISIKAVAPSPWLAYRKCEVRNTDDARLYLAHFHLWKRWDEDPR